MIRVLVADDSLTVRKRIVDLLSAHPDFQVVAEAADGREVVEACQRLRPDVVTMDMMMPVMTGLAATEYIMAFCPTPILIVSSSTNRGEIFKTYDALAAGALDVLEKPRDDEVESDWEQRLVGTLRIISRIKVITHPRGRLSHLSRHPLATTEPPPRPAGAPPTRCELVAIGASTGGPGAVLDILRDLPRDFSLPILVVIHISRVLGGGFADWLNGLSPFPVAFARHGERLPPPGACRVVLAPPDEHLMVRDGCLWLTRDEERHSCRPSVDTLFESVAAQLGPRTAGCLLTGMGRDGALGLLALRKAGARTIAQDEATSVVFGMPREAIRLGAAEHVLGLDRIAPTLAAFAAERPRLSS
jgi:two-component system chemotaxis response regulator CheB